MINLNKEISHAALICNFFENSKLNKDVVKYAIFKPMLAISISCALLSPSFCNASEIKTQLNNVTSQQKHNDNRNSALEKMLKMSRDKKNIKMLSFDTKNFSGYGNVDVKIIDSRFPSYEIYQDVINNYHTSLDKKTDEEVILTYKPWLKMNISMYEFILSGKEGFSKDSVVAMEDRVTNLKNRLSDFESKKHSIGANDKDEIRSFIKNDLSRSNPSLDYIENAKNSIAVAASFYGSCSILYNNDIMPKFERILLRNSDNKAIYNSEKNIIKMFFLNHEITHCESQQSDFIINNHNRAKEEYNKIKTSSLFQSLDENQLTKISQLAATYSEYSFEAYSDIISISKTIRDSGLKGSSASNLVNDVINMRDRLSFLGDAGHSTGDLIKKVKNYYDKNGMGFGEDLLDGNIDKNIESLIMRVSPNDFLESIRRFTLISSYSKKMEINFKDIDLSVNKEVSDIDYAPIYKTLGGSQADINKHVSSLNNTLHVFSNSDNREKIKSVIKNFNNELSSPLRENGVFFSLGM